MTNSPYMPTYERSYGNKYEETKDLDIVEVAKRVKKEIRKEFPGFKPSVTTDKYSGGQSIRVEIKTVPEDFKIFNEEWVQLTHETGRMPHHLGRYTEEAKAFLKSIERMVGAYNYDGSDSMVDYFDVRYYSTVDFDYDLEDERKAALIKRLTENEMSKEDKVHALVEVNRLKANLEEVRAKMASLNEEIARLEAELN